MALPVFELKSYQRETLNSLRTFLAKTVELCRLSK